MLGDKFTGAELAAEVNDKLSLSQGGTIFGDVNMNGNFTCDKMHSVTQSGELIPFQAFKIIQYQGNSKDPRENSYQEIQTGINEIKMVMVFKHETGMPQYNYSPRSHPMGIATPDFPYKDGDAKVVLEIVNGGFKVYTYAGVSSSPASDGGSYGLNSQGIYTALIFA